MCPTAKSILILILVIAAVAAAVFFHFYTQHRAFWSRLSSHPAALYFHHVQNTI
jgi:hypothetical protein